MSKGRPQTVISGERVCCCLTVCYKALIAQLITKWVGWMDISVCRERVGDWKKNNRTAQQLWKWKATKLIGSTKNFTTGGKKKKDIIRCAACSECKSQPKSVLFSSLEDMPVTHWSHQRKTAKLNKNEWLPRISLPHTAVQCLVAALQRWFSKWAVPYHVAPFQHWFLKWAVPCCVAALQQWFPKWAAPCCVTAVVPKVGSTILCDCSGSQSGQCHAPFPYLRTLESFRWGVVRDKRSSSWHQNQLSKKKVLRGMLEMWPGVAWQLEKVWGPLLYFGFDISITSSVIYQIWELKKEIISQF